MVSNTLNQLYIFLGSWGVGFIATLLFIIIVRIGIGFVFKIFRLNIDYNTMSKKLGGSKK